MNLRELAWAFSCNCSGSSLTKTFFLSISLCKM
uniref:Uncharacterized protein n=1 Tax=Lepeophtheirus salmonis TaxID=72036 RepID=A0A0K2V2J6_LEPSM